MSGDSEAEAAGMVLAAPMVAGRSVVFVGMIRHLHQSAMAVALGQLVLAAAEVLYQHHQETELLQPSQEIPQYPLVTLQGIVRCQVKEAGRRLRGL